MKKIGTYYQLTNPWKKCFQNKPVTTFKCNKNLKELVGSNKIENNIVKKINKSTLKLGKCSPSFQNSRTLCCNQVTTTSTFKSEQTQKTHKIFYEVNCSSAYVIYFMECTLRKKQYVGKAETTCNIRLNSHRNGLKNPRLKTIFACEHFWERNHNFNKHAKFIIIDKLTTTKKPKEVLRQRLIQRENFWIQILDTIYPKGFNQELSK